MSVAYAYAEILRELTHADIRDTYDANLDVNEPDVLDNYLLNVACEYFQVENVEFFISKEANLEYKTDFCNTPLLITIDYAHLNHDAALKIVQLLLDNGANIEARGWMMYTPFLLACVRDDLDMIKLLISMGCDVDATVEYFGEIENGLMLADIREVREYLKTVMR
jgi:ankyrin repeat protein